MTNSTDDAITQELDTIVGSPHVSAIAVPGAYGLDGLAPRWLVAPAGGDEVAAILRLANREKLAVLPRGSGTKTEWGGKPRAGDLILSTRRLNRIVDYDAPNLTVTVEAGVTLGELRRTLAAQGNFLPLDAPCAEATIGGVLATNSSGPRRLLYGSARDLTLGVHAVLPQGEAVRFGGKVMKNVAGLDMTKLLIGSLGTLGLITEATFRLLPLPELEKTLGVTFTSLEHAAKAASAILASQLVPSAIELLNAAGWQRVSKMNGGYHLAIDVEGFQEAVERQIADLMLLANKEGAVQITVVEGAVQDRIWSALRDFSQAAAADEAGAVGLRLNVPLARVEEMVNAAEQKAAEGELACAICAHAGTGTLYVSWSGARAGMEPLVQTISDLQHAAERAGGSAIVESAPWPIKERVAVWGEPRPEWSLMRKLKSEFDPVGILNPGRFVGGI